VSVPFSPLAGRRCRRSRQMRAARCARTSPSPQERPLLPARGEKMSAKPTDEGPGDCPRSPPSRLSTMLVSAPRQRLLSRGALQRATGANPAESAVDLAEASCFRSFAAVNGLRPPGAARETRAIDGGKTSEGPASAKPTAWRVTGRVQSTKSGAERGAGTAQFVCCPCNACLDRLAQGRLPPNEL
jgi:hypothetical protein